MKRLSFITQFKIEFLLTFTCCRKVYEKMPYIPVSRASFSKNIQSLLFLHKEVEYPNSLCTLGHCHNQGVKRNFTINGSS